MTVDGRNKLRANYGITKQHLWAVNRQISPSSPIDEEEELISHTRFYCLEANNSC